MLLLDLMEKPKPTTINNVFDILEVEYHDGGVFQVAISPPKSFPACGTKPGRERYIAYGPGEIVPSVAFNECTEDCNRGSNKSTIATGSDIKAFECGKSALSEGHPALKSEKGRKSPRPTKLHIQPLGNNSYALVGDSIEVRAHRNRKTRMLDQGTKTLCPKCQAIDLRKLSEAVEEEHHQTFHELSVSTETCRLCSLLLESAGDPETLVPDNSHSIRLAGIRSKSGGLSHVQLRIPTLVGDLANKLQDNPVIVRCVNLETVTDHR